jgi:hypothetical protein
MSEFGLELSSRGVRDVVAIGRTAERSDHADANCDKSFEDDKNSCRYFTPALRSTPSAVGTFELVPRPACFMKHLSPVFTASGP